MSDLPTLYITILPVMGNVGDDSTLTASWRPNANAHAYVPAARLREVEAALAAMTEERDSLSLTVCSNNKRMRTAIGWTTFNEHPIEELADAAEGIVDALTKVTQERDEARLLLDGAREDRARAEATANERHVAIASLRERAEAAEKRAADAYRRADAAEAALVTVHKAAEATFAHANGQRDAALAAVADLTAKLASAEARVAALEAALIDVKGQDVGTTPLSKIVTHRHERDY